MNHTKETLPGNPEKTAEASDPSQTASQSAPQAATQTPAAEPAPASRKAGKTGKNKSKRGKRNTAISVLSILSLVLAALFVTSTVTAGLLLRSLKAKEDELASLRSDHARELRDAQNDKEEALSQAIGLTGRLEVLENELAGLKTELTALTAERDELKKTLEDTDPIHEQLNARIAELERLSADKQSEIDALTERLNNSPAGKLGLLSLGELVRSAPKRIEQITETGADGFPVVREAEVTPAVALYYADLTAGYSISYGEELSFASGDLRQLAQALALLETEWNSLSGIYTYDPSHEVHGSGILKSKPAGTEFSRLDLIDLVLRYNDATASHVLSLIYGDEKTDVLLSSLGIGSLTETVTLKDAVLLWQEVWRVLCSAEPYSDPLRVSLCGAVTSGMSSLLPSGTVLHRYTLATGAYHDMGIVTEPSSPYLLIVLTDMGYATDEVVSYVSSLETEAIRVGSLFAE